MCQRILLGCFWRHVQICCPRFPCQCIFPKASESKELSWGSCHVVVPLVFHDELTLLGAKVFDKVSSRASSVLFILFRISSCSFDNNHKTITFHFLFVLAEKVVVKSAFLMWSWKKGIYALLKAKFLAKGKLRQYTHCFSLWPKVFEEISSIEFQQTPK